MSNIEEKAAKTANYFRNMLKVKGESLSRFETSHIMMLYFYTEGLSILDDLKEEQRKSIEQYVLSLQIPTGGWAPSSFYTGYINPTNQFNIPHIVFTYSAVNILTITGGLHKINKHNCLKSIARCAKQNGSYSSFQCSQEADLRFIYAAVAVCKAFNDFSILNREKTLNFIHKCLNFDGGYGLRPNCESHSGAIYCAIATLKMLEAEPFQPKRTLNFLINRQATNLKEEGMIGVQGRVGKLPDSCYTFWVGASISLLTSKNLLNPKIKGFIELCFKEKQCSFSKYPINQNGDPVHSLHSITGLKILNNDFQSIELERGVKKQLQGKI